MWKRAAVGQTINSPSISVTVSEPMFWAGGYADVVLIEKHVFHQRLISKPALKEPG